MMMMYIYYFFDNILGLRIQDSGHDSVLMCNASLDILYISFLFIFMWQCIYLMLLL
jgi:hypothetical protein